MRPLMAGGIGRVSIGLLALVPLSLVLKVLGASDLVVFAAAGLAVIPLAHLMGVATDEIGKHAGPGIGGFLNATFGNATEMIIALAALIRAGSLIAAGDPASLAGGERLVEVVQPLNRERLGGAHAYIGEGILANSGEFDGLESGEARKARTTTTAMTAGMAI